MSLTARRVSERCRLNPVVRHPPRSASEPREHAPACRRVDARRRPTPTPPRRFGLHMHPCPCMATMVYVIIRGCPGGGGGGKVGSIETRPMPRQKWLVPSGRARRHKGSARGLAASGPMPARMYAVHTPVGARENRLDDTALPATPLSLTTALPPSLLPSFLLSASPSGRLASSPIPASSSEKPSLVSTGRPARQTDGTEPPSPSGPPPGAPRAFNATLPLPPTPSSPPLSLHGRRCGMDQRDHGMTAADGPDAAAAHRAPRPPRLQTWYPAAAAVSLGAVVAPSTPESGSRQLKHAMCRAAAKTRRSKGRCEEPRIAGPSPASHMPLAA